MSRMLRYFLQRLLYDLFAMYVRPALRDAVETQRGTAQQGARAAWARQVFAAWPGRGALSVANLTANDETAEYLAAEIERAYRKRNRPDPQDAAISIFYGMFTKR